MNKGVIFAIGVIVLAAAVTAVVFTRPAPQTTPAAAATAPAAPIAAADTSTGALSPQAAAALAKSNGFQYLISYTDNGFEPIALDVKKGETVRFTNNSQGGLWVASQALPGATVYPGQSDCGASVLDTCMVLKRGDFWEFTFDAAGTWSYKNNSDSAKTGTVTVR